MRSGISPVKQASNRFLVENSYKGVAGRQANFYIILMCLWFWLALRTASIYQTLQPKAAYPQIMGGAKTPQDGSELTQSRMVILCFFRSLPSARLSLPAMRAA